MKRTKRPCVVYQIRNEINNDRYIGVAVNLGRRKKEHLRFLDNNKHNNKNLQEAWNEYGGNHFIFEVIQVCDVSERMSIEQKIIDENKNKGDYHLYNIALISSPPSRLGCKLSKVTRMKMIMAHMGHTTSEETKQKIGKGTAGIHRTTEEKEHLSKIRKGMKFPNGYNKKV